MATKQVKLRRSSAMITSPQNLGLANSAKMKADDAYFKSPSRNNSQIDCSKRRRSRDRLLFGAAPPLLLLVVTLNYCCCLLNASGSYNNQSDSWPTSSRQQSGFLRQIPNSVEVGADLLSETGSGTTGSNLEVRSRRHLQASIAQQMQIFGQHAHPLAFALEPPALVEYSNSTGALIHCRPATPTSGQQPKSQAAQRRPQGGKQATTSGLQQAGERPSISWRRITRVSAFALEEVELKMRTETLASGAQTDDDEGNSPRRPARPGAHANAPFVRPDGALVLPPVAPALYKRQLHAAQYRCCLTDASGRSLCSRQVHTRPVFDSKLSLSVFDELAPLNQLAIFRCLPAASGHSSPQLEFTGWLRDDKLLATWDETRLARKLAIDHPLAQPAHQVPPTQTSFSETGGLDYNNVDLMAQQQMAAGLQAPRFLTARRGELLIVRNTSGATQQDGAQLLAASTFKCRARNKLTGEQTISQPGAKLVLLDPEQQRSAAGNSIGAPEVEADKQPASVVMAREHEDVLLCAKFVQKATVATRFRWFRQLENGQRILLASDGVQQQQQQQTEAALFWSSGVRQLGACLSIGQASQGRHAGDYISEQQASLNNSQLVVASRHFKLLISPQRLEVQLRVQGHQGMVAAAGRHQLPPQPSASNLPLQSANEFLHQVPPNAFVQLECALKASPPIELNRVVQLTIMWLHNSKLLFNLPYELLTNTNSSSGTSDEHTSHNRQQAARLVDLSEAYSYNHSYTRGVRLVQANTIAIDSFDPEHAGYYQCLVYASTVPASVSDNPSSSSSAYDVEEREQSYTRGQLQRELLANLKLAHLQEQDELASRRRQQLETSEEFQREKQAFASQLEQLVGQLSGSGHLQLEPIESRPQIIKMSGADSTRRLASSSKLSLECLATGLPAPKIIWLLDNLQLIDSTTAGSQRAPEVDVTVELDDLLAVGGGGKVPGGGGRHLLTGGRALEMPAGRFSIETTRSLQQAGPVTRSQLNVSQLDAADAGQYKCVAWNAHGQVELATLVLIDDGFGGEDPAGEGATRSTVSLRTYQSRNVTLLAGETGLLTCPLVSNSLLQATASKTTPNVQVQWRHANERLPATQRHRLIGPAGQQLEISNVDARQDGGQYACQLPGSAEEASIQVHVRLAPLIDVQSLPEVVQATEGMRNKLVCSIVQGEHPIDIKWLRKLPARNSRANLRGSSQLASNAGVRLLDGRQLEGYELMSNVQALEVASPEAETSSGELPGQQQDLVTLHNLEDSCLLTFKQVSARDAGDYLCLAQNHLSVALRQVHLVVNVPPSWSMEPPSDVYVQLHERLQLDCLAHGHPQPVASWRRLSAALGNATSNNNAKNLINGDSLKLGGQPLRVRSLQNGSLIIERVELSDAGGVFQCEASNGIGSGSLAKLVHLHVQVAPYFQRPSAQKTSLLVAGQLGGKAELKCQPQGDQPMIVGWRKDSGQAGEPIDLVFDQRRKVASRSLQQQQLESTLTISNLSRHDSGLYSCIASNEFGTDELQVGLLVQEAPEEPDLLRPVRAEARQATLTFKRPFDGNSALRKYAIHYKQLGPGTAAPELLIEQFSSGGTQTNSSSNSLSQATSAGELRDASLQDDTGGEWRQSIVNAVPTQQTELSVQSRSSSSAAADQQLVSVQLCCLKPFTRYAARLAAINDLGASNLTRAPVRFQTDEEAIGGPPLEVVVEPTGAHSLKVRWREPVRQLQNGLIRGYYIGYRALAGNGGQTASSGLPTSASGQLGAQPADLAAMAEQYQYKNVQLDLLSGFQGQQQASWWQPQVALEEGNVAATNSKQEPNRQQSYSTYLTNLRRKTAYSIIVQAYNKIGAGPRSDQLIVATLDAAPPMSPVLKLLSTSHNSAQFSWTTRRFQTNTNNNGHQATAPSATDDELLLDESVALADDDDPMAYCTINFKLAERSVSRTPSGGGPQSATLASDHAQAQPEEEWQQKRITARPPQQQVQQMFAGAQQQQLQAAAQQHQMLQRRRSVSLGNLRCGSAYLAYMTATNSLGQSEPGETVRFQTRGAAPQPPALASDCLRVNSTFVMIKLGAWHNSGCLISSFLIRYKQVGSDSANPHLKWVALEHQVHPTIQTTTISGTSVFSTRAHSSGHHQAQARLVATNEDDALELARRQPSSLDDFVLRNLAPDSSYKLQVEANSEAGATISEFEFETGNFSAALVWSHVTGLLAQQQAATSGDTNLGLQANFFGPPARLPAHDLEFQQQGQPGVWSLQARHQNLGVWSLTIVFVAASFLLAITTLVLGFKSLVRMKQQQQAQGHSGRNGRGRHNQSQQNHEQLAAALLCCSSSSTASSAGSHNSDSSTTSACNYQTVNNNGQLTAASLQQQHLENVNELEHSFQHQLEPAGTPYCSLPIDQANPLGGTLLSSGRHFSLAGRAQVASGETAPYGPPSISGLLMRTTPNTGLSEDFRQTQMVSSSSLSAIMAAAASGQQRAQTSSRNTMTLAPASRRSLLLAAGQQADQQQQQQMQIQSPLYAATLGRQQHATVAGSLKFNQHYNQVYNRILNSSQKQLQVDEMQACDQFNGATNSPSLSSYQLFASSLLANNNNNNNEGLETGGRLASTNTTSGYGTPPLGSHQMAPPSTDEHQAGNCYAPLVGRQQPTSGEPTCQQLELYRQQTMADCGGADMQAAQACANERPPAGKFQGHTHFEQQQGELLGGGGAQHQQVSGPEERQRQAFVQQQDAYGMLFGCHQ